MPRLSFQKEISVSRIHFPDVWRDQLCLWKRVAPDSGLIGVRSHEPDSAVKRSTRAQSTLSKRYDLIPAWLYIKVDWHSPAAISTMGKHKALCCGNSEAAGTILQTAPPVWPRRPQSAALPRAGYRICFDQDQVQTWPVTAFLQPPSPYCSSREISFLAIRFARHFGFLVPGVVTIPIGALSNPCAMAAYIRAQNFASICSKRLSSPFSR
jgi:hypothetical protein